MTSDDKRLRVNTTWLIKLRWVAVIGQLLTMVVASSAFQIELTWWPLAIVLAVTIASNIVLIAWFRFLVRRDISLYSAAWNRVLGLVVATDLLSLTAMLYGHGGPTNPFTLFYFVNLSLCGLLLERRWAWGMTVLSIACFAWLIYDYRSLDDVRPLVTMAPIRETGRWSLAELGLLSAFATSAAVIVYFMTRLAGELRQQEVDLRLAEQRQSRSEKWEALATLAAGAAHELASPLSTIAIVAKDVEKGILDLPDRSGHAELLDDVRLVRSQLDRCRRILDRMAGHAGQTVGETMQAVTLAQLWGAVADGLAVDRIDYHIAAEAQDRKIRVPLDALSQSLRGLIQNALDVQPAERPVVVTTAIDSHQCVWTIRDEGTGMDAEVLNRISEPFFTTKPPGKGMGLGVFLARNVIQRLGGTLTYQSAPGQGTIARAAWPNSG